MATRSTVGNDILLKIAAAIASETGRGYLNLEAIDRALRSRKPPARLQAERRPQEVWTTRSEKSPTRAVAMSMASWARQTTGAHRGGGWRDAPVPRIDSAEVPEIAIQRGGTNPSCET